MNLCFHSDVWILAVSGMMVPLGNWFRGNHVHIISPTWFQHNWKITFCRHSRYQIKTNVRAHWYQMHTRVYIFRTCAFNICFRPKHSSSEVCFNVHAHIQLCFCLFASPEKNISKWSRQSSSFATQPLHSTLHCSLRGLLDLSATVTIIGVFSSHWEWKGFHIYIYIYVYIYMFMHMYISNIFIYIYIYICICTLLLDIACCLIST